MAIGFRMTLHLCRQTSLALFLAAPLDAQPASGWRPLFDGRTLDGWAQCNGAASYTVEGATIVGRAVVGSPNSFLCTREQFGDFVLEYEARETRDLNSGVQIRSIANPAIQNGRVHGYQVEIDPSPRAWSGGIYDESRRGWLHPLTDQPAAQRAFRRGEWNRYRVEAIGPSIRTWVNGVPAADILDDLTPRGIIALQVHSIGNDSSKAGATTSFRNIRIRTANLAAVQTPPSRSGPQYNYIANTLSDRERAQGWTLLWDGRSTTGWRGGEARHVPRAGMEHREWPPDRGRDRGARSDGRRRHRDRGAIRELRARGGSTGSRAAPTAASSTS